MSYTVKYKMVDIECETIDDLMALLVALERNHNVKPPIAAWHCENCKAGWDHPYPPQEGSGGIGCNGLRMHTWVHV